MDKFYLLIYNLFAKFVKSASDSLIDKTGYTLARFAYYASPKRRGVIKTNLKLCFKDIKESETREIAIRSYRNLIYNIVSFIKREDQTKERLLKNIAFENEEIVYDLLKKGKKIIFITAHYGVWEMIPPALTTKFGFDLSIVGRELDAKSLQPILQNARERFNVKLINRRGAMRGMIKALSRGDMLGLLVDQSIRKDLSQDVTFFGRTVTHTPAASILAKKFHASIVPLFITTEDFKNFTIKFYTPIEPNETLSYEDDIKRLTQAQADIVESVIKEKRDEWFWSHKRFKVYDSDLYT